KGRYRIVGLPCSGPYSLQAVLPVGVAFLPSARTVEAGTGFDPVRLDFALTRGVLVHGRITDKATGKPVAGAEVDYFVFLDNPRPRAAPGFRATSSGPDTRRRRDTDADGRFTLVGFPGRGIVAAKVRGDASIHYLAGVGADAITGKRARQNDFLTDPFICVE